MTSRELKELEEFYPIDRFHIEELYDKEQIEMYAKSKMAICWGNGPIKGTRFYKLCHTSPQRQGDKQLILVCDKKEVTR